MMYSDDDDIPTTDPRVRAITALLRAVERYDGAADAQAWLFCLENTAMLYAAG